LIFVIGLRNERSQNQLAGDFFPCAGRCGHAREIGLYSTRGNDGVAAGRRGVAHQVFQFAQLVATATEAQQIVALYVQFDPVQRCTHHLFDALQPIDRRGRIDQGDSGHAI
jgi:hypothetical protein